MSSFKHSLLLVFKVLKSGLILFGLSSLNVDILAFFGLATVLATVLATFQ
jgi:hypothetical protein